MLSGVAVTVEQLLGLRFPAGRLDLGGRRWPRSALTGGRVSRFRGRGMDFDESRLYLPGDDIRILETVDKSTRSLTDAKSELPAD